jgi:hypothetical protein
LTNSHCVESLKSKVKMRLGSKVFMTTPIAKAVDQDTIDVCLLQIQNWKSFGQPYANKNIEICYQDELREGDRVYAVGFGYY